MRKTFCLVLFACLLPAVAKAETKETRSTQKHEFRIGYGDPMYETMRWKDESNKLGVPMNARLPMTTATMVRTVQDCLSST